MQIQTLKDQLLTTQPVSVEEHELEEEFLNEHHHLGGEMVVFKTQEQAQLFCDTVAQSAQWEAMKVRGDPPVRPVSVMTLEAYRDLWGIPHAQLETFHAMPIGSISSPMPFGKQWCIYRLLEKRIGDLNEFPAQREAYLKQVTIHKQFEALKRWMAELITSAHLTLIR